MKYNDRIKNVPRPAPEAQDLPPTPPMAKPVRTNLPSQVKKEPTTTSRINSPYPPRKGA